jgi:hypothetical protein
VATIDPKAGEWKHEILLRMLFACGTAGIMLVANLLVNEYGRTWDDLRNVLPPVAGFAACAPEGMLRRSWRVGLFAALVGTAACCLGFWSAHWQHQEGGFDENAIRLAAMSLGAAWGLCAGVSSRSLAATILAFLSGQAGGLVGYACFSTAYGDFFAGWLRFSTLFLPMAAMIGVGVWLGVRLSRRKEQGRG